MLSRAWQDGDRGRQHRWVPWRTSSFVELFSHLPDPRVERTRRHSLESILFLCLCEVVCGANDLVSIERFGSSRQALLERFIEFPAGIPSHDTIGRVLAKLDPEPLEDLLAQWMRGVTKATKEGVVALDSKVLRLKKMICGFRNRERFRNAIDFHLGGLDLKPAALQTHTNS